MTALPKKVQSFEKDELANNIVALMLDPEFTEMPETYKAQRADCSLSEYASYMKDPAFLNWMGKRLPELYKAKLPDLMKTVFEQALQGKGRQQKMMMEVMGMLDQKQEQQNPNITIINNIPNPDDFKPKEIIDVIPE